MGASTPTYDAPRTGARRPPRHGPDAPPLPERTGARGARDAGPLVRRLAGARRWLGPAVGLVVFAAALALLHRDLRLFQYHEVASAVRRVPAGRLLLALALTAVNFVIMAGYDALALRYVGRAQPARRTALASSVGFTVGMNLGFPTLTGGSVRYRFWSSWGLSTPQIARAMTFLVLTFWLGVAAVGGVTLLVVRVPPGMVSSIPGGAAHLSGAVLLGVVAAYAALAVARRGTAISLGQWAFPVPSPPTALAQLGVGVLDWVSAAAVAYALLPPSPGLHFPTFLGVFLLAHVLGIVSHVPGGLGVFEAVVVLLLKPYVPTAPLLGALVVYRAVYYFVPFGLAVLVLVGREVRDGQSLLGATSRRAARTTGRWLPAVLPQVLSVATFVAGAVLLFSGATPPVGGRIALLSRLLPLGVIEASHFAGSIAGAALLVLALAIRRRLDAAWGLTVALLAAGIVASLLKGFDWEEALLLAGVLGALLPARRGFYRKAALTSEPLTPGWVVAILTVAGVTVWLGLFAYKHVEYRDELWWQFTVHGDASRFLRSTVAVLAVLLVFGLLRLLQHARAAPPPLADADVARVADVVARSPSLEGNLALLGDKSVMFSADGSAFLMYAVEGRSWVALGDPVGPPAQHAELAWRFREMADRYAGWPVFYEVGTAELPLYLDLGLTLLKLGEEARVPLEGFGLEGGSRRGLRRTHRDVAKQGATFEIVPASDVPALLPELRTISDAWLALKHTREKGFSLGRFDERYLRSFPAALVRIHGRTVAFANVWLGAEHEEMSVDLMRYVPDAPHGVMEYMFAELMLWGKAEGYRWFTLGMAPLSGLQDRTLAPFWNRAGAFLFRHGEHFYNFQGLRQYKDKFDPVWEPRYLASPGGLALPRILANVAALISGGLSGMVAK